MQVASARSSRSRGDISGSSAQTPASKRTRVGEEPTPLNTSQVPRKGEQDAPSAQNCSRRIEPHFGFRLKKGFVVQRRDGALYHDNCGGDVDLDVHIIGVLSLFSTFS